MKPLGDILIGFLIFFAIDRAIRLFSNGIVQPWAEKKTTNERIIENWKLGVELALLILAFIIVLNSQGIIRHFNKA